MKPGPVRGRAPARPAAVQLACGGARVEGHVDSGISADVAAKLQSFVEQSTDFIGVADPWGRILYLNPAACKRLGVADYSDLTLADLFPTEAFAYYYEVVRPELLRTGAWSGEVLVNAA